MKNTKRNIGKYSYTKNIQLTAESYRLIKIISQVEGRFMKAILERAIKNYAKSKKVH